MVFDRNNIKISFDRPKYVTENNKVKCILTYRINVPSFVHDEDRFPAKGYNPAAVHSCGEFYLGDELTATGVATCGPEEKDDISEARIIKGMVGREIAEARAEAKAYKHAEKLLKRYVKTVVDAYSNMLLAFEAKADCVQRHNAEYTAEVGR